MANCSYNNNAHVQCCIGLLIFMVLMQNNVVTGETRRIVSQMEMPSTSDHKVTLQSSEMGHSHTSILTTNNLYEKTILDSSMKKDLQMDTIPYPGSLNGAGNQGTYKKVQYYYSRNMIHGVKARVNIWNPQTLEGEASMAFLSLNAGIGHDASVITAGWVVAPPEFKDHKTRFFVYWTDDHGNRTGCFNLKCPGFVLTDHTFDFSRPIEHVSAYEGVQHYIDMEIKRTSHGSRWGVYIDQREIGYWQSHIFRALFSAASHCTWGAQVYDSHSMDHPTTTQMGSGHFPEEGANKASSFSNIEYFNIRHTVSTPEAHDLKTEVTHPGCYRLSQVFTGPGRELHFFYGGPGGHSPNCTF